MHFEVIIVHGETWVWCYSSYEHHHVLKTVRSAMYVLGTFFENYLALRTWIYFWILSSVLLVCVTITMLKPCCFGYCSFVYRQVLWYLQLSKVFISTVHICSTWWLHSSWGVGACIYISSSFIPFPPFHSPPLISLSPLSFAKNLCLLEAFCSSIQILGFFFLFLWRMLLVFWWGWDSLMSFVCACICVYHLQLLSSGLYNFHYRHFSLPWLNIFLGLFGFLGFLSFVFAAIANGTTVSTSFSGSLLLVYINAADFF